MRKLIALVLAAGLLSTSAFAVDNGRQRAQKANHRAQKKYLKAQRKAMKKAQYGPRHTVKNRSSR